MNTYRVKVEVCGTRTYEIDAATEEEARKFFTEGVLVYDDTDDAVISVIPIDTAEVSS